MKDSTKMMETVQHKFNIKEKKVFSFGWQKYHLKPKCKNWFWIFISEQKHFEAENPNMAYRPENTDLKMKSRLMETMQSEN